MSGAQQESWCRDLELVEGEYSSWAVASRDRGGRGRTETGWMAVPEGGRGEDRQWSRESARALRLRENGYHGAEFRTSVMQQLRGRPDDASLKDFLAFLSYSGGDYSRAGEIYLELVREGNQTPSRCYFLANCYSFTGDIESAIRWWSEVSRMEPESSLARKARLRVKLLGGDVVREPPGTWRRALP